MRLRTSATVLLETLVGYSDCFRNPFFSPTHFLTVSGDRDLNKKVPVIPALEEEAQTVRPCLYPRLRRQTDVCISRDVLQPEKK